MTVSHYRPLSLFAGEDVKVDLPDYPRLLSLLNDGSSASLSPAPTTTTTTANSNAPGNQGAGCGIRPEAGS